MTCIRAASGASQSSGDDASVISRLSALSGNTEAQHVFRRFCDREMDIVSLRFVHFCHHPTMCRSRALAGGGAMSLGCAPNHRGSISTGWEDSTWEIAVHVKFLF